MSRFKFIEEYSAAHPIEKLCRFCRVERSSYYNWLGAEDKPEELKLVAEIRNILAQSRSTYGAIRMTRELKALGWVGNRKKVARIMRQEGLKSLHKRKFKLTITIQ